MKMKQDIAGYKEINTPDIMDKSYGNFLVIWEKFGAQYVHH